MSSQPETGNVLTGNVAQGDIAGGDIHKHVHLSSKPALREAIEKLQEEYVNDQEFKGLVESLNHYFKHKTSKPVLGIEHKLNISGRADILDDAIALKESFAKRLVRQQLLFEKGSPKVVWIRLNRVGDYQIINPL